MIWINVGSDFKPEAGEEVLMWHEWEGVLIGEWDGDMWWVHITRNDSRRSSDHITHWTRFTRPSKSTA